MSAFDVEWDVASMVADYLRSVVDADIMAGCQIVTFFDPMSIDEANRVTVMVPSAATSVTSPGNWTARVECGVKSQWAQPTVENDLKAHQARVRQVREKLMLTDLVSRLQDAAPAGCNIEFAQPHRELSTDILDSGWSYSKMSFDLQGFSTNA